MITAVDKSVLVDILRNDVEFAARSSHALRMCMKEGQVVACDVVWAELVALFPSVKAFDDVVRLLAIEFSPLGKEAASMAGELWRKHRARGGTRARIMADFLIGAHAQCQCDRLLTRDRGFYRDYFKRLRVLDPSAKANA